MNVVPRPRNGLSLCAGAGGLDMGLGLAEPDFHTRCYVEWEEYPRSRIIAAQRAGYFAPGPIWDDVTTFDAKPLAGAIDTVIGGYPCQGESLAGKRLGTEDDRWLWDDFERIIRELGCHLQWCFFENVRGHVSSGLQTVLRGLHGLGFATSVGIFSAGETGASHERQRVFIVAYRESPDRGREQQPGSAGSGWGRFARDDRSYVEDAKRTGTGGGKPPTDQQGRDAVDGRREVLRCGDRASGPNGATSDGEGQSSGLGDAAGIGRGKGQPEPIVRSGRDTPTSTGRELANTSCEGSQGRKRPGASAERDGQAPYGSTPQRGRPRLFPPGPADRDGWLASLAVSPDLAPALSVSDVKRACDDFAQMVEEGRMEEAEAESIVRSMADGLSQRTSMLKVLGNAVLPLQAAYAWRNLSWAHGLCGVDFGEG